MEMLREFHTKFYHTWNNYPTIQIASHIKELRIKLVDEEARELIDAIQQDNLIEIADALADLLYVTFGTALTYGIPIDRVFEEVHRSNMTKSMLKDEKSIKGKTLKGPDWSPPQIGQVLWGDEPRTAKGSLD